MEMDTYLRNLGKRLRKLGECLGNLRKVAIFDEI
jgi:hypothetical protein